MAAPTTYSRAVAASIPSSQIKNRLSSTGRVTKRMRMAPEP